MLDIETKCFSYFVVFDETGGIRSKILVKQLWTLQNMQQVSVNGRFYLHQHWSLFYAKICDIILM